ncbi:MAG: ABC transporter permease subunit [Candidatus Omnitrophica bacterium]|nr:ABC transporter permease subunit [Candidatus Omnitrophota bacterium]
MNRPVKRTFFWMTVLILVCLLVFPMYIMLKISVSAPRDVFTQNPPYLVRHFTLSHFRDVLASGSVFFAPLSKSVVTALGTSVLSLLLTVPAAYAISRFRYRARYGLILVIFLTRMIPEISIALPVSITFIKGGLFDTVFGLMLAHLVRVLPISCFILVGVFSSFPKELEKQALIDGAGRLYAFFKIVLPLSLRGISVAGIFSFMFSWDEFIYASYLTLSKPTMPLKMYYYISRGNIFSSATYAVIITIPVLIFTFALQRYIRPGYLSGAMKG